MSGHTPGPWTRWVGHAEVYAGVGAVNEPWRLGGRRKGAPMPCVARCDDDDDLDEYEQACNAQLISAAPDLLAACQAALPHHRGRTSKAGRLLRAAIIKALTIPEEP